MLSISRKMHTLIYKEIYFSAGVSDDRQGEDVRYILQSKAAEADSVPFCTSLIDLHQNEKDIFNAIKKGFSYDIRRARDKDHVTVTSFFLPDSETQKRFIKFYNRFATSKQLAAANSTKLEKLAAAGGLAISFAFKENSPTELCLCAHAYICDGARARLLYSAGNVLARESQDRQLIGRANKLMHWQMITTFRSQGFVEYDLGGLGEDADVKSIAEFKRAFGGRDVVEYNALRGVSLKGKLAVYLFRLMQRFKGRSIV